METKRATILKKRIRCLIGATFYTIGTARIGWHLHVAHSPTLIAALLGLLGITIALLAIILETFEGRENKQ